MSIARSLFAERFFGALSYTPCPFFQGLLRLYLESIEEVDADRVQLGSVELVF